MLIFSVSLLAANTPVLADQVTLVDGKQFSNCKMESENAKEVRFTVAGQGERVLPSEEVAAVLYDDRPLDYRQADLYLNGGSYARAAEMFKALHDGAQAGAWLRTYAAYYHALALARWAQSDPAKAPEAVQALTAFVKDHADSRFVYDAKLGLAELLLSEQQEQARKHLGEVLAAKPKSGWARTARLLEAQVKLRQNDAAGALTDVEAVLATLTDKAAPAWAQAALAKGQALLALGRLPEAEKLLADLIETTQDARVRAQAYNALGDAYFRTENFGEARLRYLRVVLLYAKADPVEHAKALYYAAECSQRLNDPKRAADLFKELVEQYPGTPWAAKVPAGAGK
jgi:tetratricopeptide (TPR) repeat protein